MTLLTAFAIYFGQYPDLHYKMKEAVKRMDMKSIQSEKFLCEETVRALRVLKTKEKKGRES